MDLKKTVKIFGKVVPVWLIASLALVGLGGAALVGYLSNTITATTTVSSPVELWVWDGTGYIQTSITYTIYGGETTTTYVKSQNHANVATSGKVQVTVENWAGVTCLDLTSVKYNGVEWSGTCTQVDNYHVTLTAPVTWSSGLVKEDTITATFATNALGTYTLTGVVVPT